jgi:hypothetical protein
MLAELRPADLPRGKGAVELRELFEGAPDLEEGRHFLGGKPQLDLAEGEGLGAAGVLILAPPFQVEEIEGQGAPGGVAVSEVVVDLGKELLRG